MVGLPGFEPESREPKSHKDFVNEGIDWRDFEKWLQNRLNKAYAAKVHNYAKNYCYVLREPAKASTLSGLSKDKRRNVMAALANLAKQLGMYGFWKQLVSETGLHWQKTSHLEVFLSMFNTDMGDTKSWFKETSRIASHA
jgi:hypothetical protein